MEILLPEPLPLEEAAPLPGLDPDLVASFEAQLDPARLGAGPMPVRILGAGPISTAFELEAMPGIALKRLPPFRTPERRTYYLRAVAAYRQLLNDQLGIGVVPQQGIPLTSRSGEPILYVAQQKLPAENVLPPILRRCSDELARSLVLTILRNTIRVWYRNEIDRPDRTTGFDARISNWAVTYVDGDAVELTYVDTVTPFMHRIGYDVVDAEIFLRRLPPPFARRMRDELTEVLKQYYDLRHVLVDLLGDLHAEGLAKRTPLALDVVNRFFEEEGREFHLERINRREVDRHRRENTRFWHQYGRLSRMDRFIRARLFRQPYPFILPQRA